MAHEGAEVQKAVPLASVHDLLNFQKLEEYLSLEENERARYLIALFDEIWHSSLYQRPETIASQLRQWLGSHAPGNDHGSPGLGIKPGFACTYKAVLALTGVHSAMMMGICSNQDKVATAIALNGGYADDVDYGTTFVYVGEGGESDGRNQELHRGNMALLKACLQDKPIRVIRGWRAKSRFAPAWGFRYDGLYKIREAFADTGVHSHRVWKFLMQSEEENYIPPKASASLTDSPAFPDYHKASAKIAEFMDRHHKDHLKVQAEVQSKPEAKRPVRVMNEKDEEVCVLRVPHCTTEKRSVPVNFDILLDTLTRAEQLMNLPRVKPWSDTVLEDYRRANSDPAKPEWAKVGFLPFVLRVAWHTKKVASSSSSSPKDGGSSKENTNDKDVDRLSSSGYTSTFQEIPISPSLANHFVHPFFPQAWIDSGRAVHSSIVLKAPFENDWDPSADVAQGREELPIPCVNNVDSEPPPTDFSYTRSTVHFCNLPDTRLVDAICQGCVPPEKLSDAIRWKTVGKRGKLLADGLREVKNGKTSSITYCAGVSEGSICQQFICECSEFCPCDSATCTNRRYSPGVKFRLTLERQSGLGWGLRTEEVITKGATVMDYAGDFVSDGELRARVKRYENAGLINYSLGLWEDDDFRDSWKSPCIDSQLMGNIGRFLNHSCEPNLDVRVLFRGPPQVVAPVVILQASRDIQKGESLTFNYGKNYSSDNAQCRCGTPSCSGFIGLSPKAQSSRRSRSHDGESPASRKRKGGSPTDQESVKRRKTAGAEGTPTAAVDRFSQPPEAISSPTASAVSPAAEGGEVSPTDSLDDDCVETRGGRELMLEGEGVLFDWNSPCRLGHPNLQ